MPKTVRALALAALFALGGTATAHAGTGTADTTTAKGRTVVVAVAALPCMAC